jgi:putative addiction module component (TIGR02574 family)
MPVLTRDEITRLHPAERLALIGDLWDSINDSELALPSAQSRELERRLVGFDEDAAKAVSWEDLTVCAETNHPTSKHQVKPGTVQSHEHICVHPRSSPSYPR